jgi:hypothetical protein
VAQCSLFRQLATSSRLALLFVSSLPRLEVMDDEETGIANVENKSVLKQKKESRFRDSLDYQGASTSLSMTSRGGGCHPLFYEELIKKAIAPDMLHKWQ